MLRALGAACTALLALAAANPAASAAHRTPQDLTSASVRITPRAAADNWGVSADTAHAATARDAAASTCTAPEQANITRTTACRNHTEDVDVINGKLTGVLTVTISHDMALNYKSTTWKDNVSIHFDKYVGDAPLAGVVLDVTVNCDSATCTATPDASLTYVPVRVGAGSTGTVTFSNPVTAIDEFKPSYTFKAIGTRSGGTGTSTFPTIRCDNDLATRVGAGCVFSKTAPVETNEAQLPGISANIRKAQQGGGPGNPNAANRIPLHFHYDKKQQKDNRDAVCPGALPPKPAPDQWCDEYPFASTKEGGTQLPEAQRSVAWVPKSEQQSQGGFISKFQVQNRVLKGDPFYVEV